jgi:hypothetical protein
MTDAATTKLMSAVPNRKTIVMAGNQRHVCPAMVSITNHI